MTTYVFVHYQRMQLRSEIKHKIIDGIDKKELVFFKFSNSEKSNLEWEHAKEFEYQGEFYDVVESKTNGDSTFYWCWWDFEETELNRKCLELVTLSLGNSPQKQENQSRLFNFFESLYCNEFEDTQILFMDTDTKMGAHQLANFYKSLSHTPPFPPPESNFIS